MLGDRRLATGFLGFLLLGMPYAALGVAWPSMAADLGRSLGDLGPLLVATSVGYVAATMANGYLTHRFGTGIVLPMASALATISIACWALSGSFIVLVAAGVVLGAAGGAVDAGVNTYVAVGGSTRAMGWLHATFGLGSALGPLVATLLIGGGASWRTVFWVLATSQLAVTVAFVASRLSWPGPAHQVEERPRLPNRLWPVLAAGLVAFAFYTGVEVAAGEWSYTLFTEGRSIDIRAAGYLVTGYWAALTVGRIAMGVAGDRVRRTTLLLGSLTGATIGAALLWAGSATPWIGAAGLLIMGLTLAPVFPVLVLITSEVLGAEHAPAAVGYQIAAAGVGAAGIPGLVGVLVGSGDVGVIGPLIAGASVLMLTAGAVVVRSAGRLGGTTG